MELIRFNINTFRSVQISYRCLISLQNVPNIYQLPLTGFEIKFLNKFLVPGTGTRKFEEIRARICKRFRGPDSRDWFLGSLIVYKFGLRIRIRYQSQWKQQQNILVPKFKILTLDLVCPSPKFSKTKSLVSPVVWAPPAGTSYAPRRTTSTAHDPAVYNDQSRTSLYLPVFNTRSVHMCCHNKVSPFSPVVLITSYWVRSSTHLCLYNSSMADEWLPPQQSSQQ